MSNKRLKDIKDYSLYGTDKYNAIPEEYFKYSEMIDSERRFLFGLINYFEPKNILEVGVASGGTSSLILSAMKDLPETRLVSIDLLNNVYNRPKYPVGFSAMEHFGNKNSQWELHGGNDPSAIIEKFGKKFDFVMIDTAHIHPVETMNFISVLPFLEDHAIIILHDLSLSAWRTFNNNGDNYFELATRILFSSVCADKVVADSYPSHYLYANIGAIQINSDTKKYIRNVFDSLFIPWRLYPSENTLKHVGNIVSKYYEQYITDLYFSAVNAALEVNHREKSGYYHVNNRVLYVADYFRNLVTKQQKYILFGSKIAEPLIQLADHLYLPRPKEIWDNYSKESSIENIPIIRPKQCIDADENVIITAVTSEAYAEMLSSLCFSNNVYWLFQGENLWLS